MYLSLCGLDPHRPNRATTRLSPGKVIVAQPRKPGHPSPWEATNHFGKRQYYLWARGTRLPPFSIV